MPAVSEAQRRYLHARFGAASVRRHHFDNPGRLPERARPWRHNAQDMKAAAQTVAGAGGRPAKPSSDADYWAGIVNAKHRSYGSR